MLLSFYFAQWLLLGQLSYITQVHLPRDDMVHSGLNPSVANNHQDYTPDIHPGQSNLGNFPIKALFSDASGCVKLTSKAKVGTIGSKNLFVV